MTAIRKPRKPPDATARFLADVRRHIRSLEKLQADTVRLCVGDALTSPADWIARATDNVSMLSDRGPDFGDEVSRDFAIRACAALYFAARGTDSTPSQAVRESLRSETDQ